MKAACRGLEQGLTCHMIQGGSLTDITSLADPLVPTEVNSQQTVASQPKFSICCYHLMRSAQIKETPWVRIRDGVGSPDSCGYGRPPSPTCSTVWRACNTRAGLHHTFHIRCLPICVKSLITLRSCRCHEPRRLIAIVSVITNPCVTAVLPSHGSR